MRGEKCSVWCLHLIKAPSVSRWSEHHDVEFEAQDRVKLHHLASVDSTSSTSIPAVIVTVNTRTGMFLVSQVIARRSWEAGVEKSGFHAHLPPRNITFAAYNLSFLCLYYSDCMRLQLDVSGMRLSVRDDRPLNCVRWRNWPDTGKLSLTDINHTYDLDR
jgi:hypothetical protein